MTTIKAQMLNARTGEVVEVETDIPEPTEAELLARERVRMRCTPVQLRLALHRAGRLTEAQAIADGDAEASIVWEYATEMYRTSPLLAAMAAGSFTDTEIDDLFRAAMEI